MTRKYHVSGWDRVDYKVYSPLSGQLFPDLVGNCCSGQSRLECGLRRSVGRTLDGHELVCFFGVKRFVPVSQCQVRDFRIISIYVYLSSRA